MTPFQQELRHAAAVFWAAVDTVLAWAAYAFRELRDSVAETGLPPAAETVLLIALVVVAIAVVLRLLRGGLRLLFAVLVALLVARALGVV